VQRGLHVELHRSCQTLVLPRPRRAITSGGRIAQVRRLRVEASAGFPMEDMALEQDLHAAVRQETRAGGLDAKDCPDRGRVCSKRGRGEVQRALRQR